MLAFHEEGLIFFLEFNGALDMFYSNRVEKIIAEKWLEEHEYDSAGADDDPSSWR